MLPSSVLPLLWCMRIHLQRLISSRMGAGESDEEMARRLQEYYNNEAGKGQPLKTAPTIQSHPLPATPTSSAKVINPHPPTVSSPHHPGKLCCHMKVRWILWCLLGSNFHNGRQSHLRQIAFLQIGPGPLQSSAGVHYPSIAGGIPAASTSVGHNGSASPSLPQQPTAG